MIRPTSSQINIVRNILLKRLEVNSGWGKPRAQEALDIYNGLIDYIHFLEGPIEEPKIDIQLETDNCIALAEFYDK